MSGIEHKGHKIEKLWNEYKTVCENEASEIEASVMSRLVADFTFGEMLHNDSDVFYNYRYLYDPERLAEIRNNPLKPQFLRVFVFAIYQSLNEKLICPDGIV